jgi:hypothetical protein
MMAGLTVSFFDIVRVFARFELRRFGKCFFFKAVFLFCCPSVCPFFPVCGLPVIGLARKWGSLCGFGRMVPYREGIAPWMNQPFRGGAGGIFISIRSRLKQLRDMIAFDIRIMH